MTTPEYASIADAVAWAGFALKSFDQVPNTPGYEPEVKRAQARLLQAFESELLVVRTRELDEIPPSGVLELLQHDPSQLLIAWSDLERMWPEPEPEPRPSEIDMRDLHKLEPPVAREQLRSHRAKSRSGQPVDSLD